MAVDLKVLVRSFNCESRACCVGNPRRSFFRVREIFFYSQKFCESCILWIIFIVKGYHILPRSPAGEWYRTIAAKLPKVRLCHGFATAKYHGLEAHPCACRWCCLTLLSEVSKKTRSKRSNQAFTSEALREPNTKAPGVCFSSDAPRADGWGLRIRVFHGISAKVLRKSGRKSKCILKGVAQ